MEFFYMICLGPKGSLCLRSECCPPLIQGGVKKSSDGALCLYVDTRRLQSQQRPLQKPPLHVHSQYLWANGSSHF